jgi:hypothetical protein
MACNATYFGSFRMTDGIIMGRNRAVLSGKSRPEYLHETMWAQQFTCMCEVQILTSYGSICYLCIVISSVLLIIIAIIILLMLCFGIAYEMREYESYSSWKLINQPSYRVQSKILLYMLFFLSWDCTGRFLSH